MGKPTATAFGEERLLDEFDKEVTSNIGWHLFSRKRSITLLAFKDFLLQRLNEPFDVGIGVRGSKRGLLRFPILCVEDRIELGRELRVSVVHQDFDFLTFGLDVGLKLFRLLHHPLLVRMERGLRDIDPTGGHVQENQHVQIAEPFDRQRLLGQKIALP